MGAPPPCRLSEEARLAGGTWEPLLPEGHPGIAEVKWCRNRFHSYLCIDPQPDEAPGSRDQEELTIEVRRRRGALLLPAVLLPCCPAQRLLH